MSINENLMALSVRGVAPRRRRDVQADKLFELALDHWMDWLLTFHVPRKQGHRVADIGSVHEAAGNVNVRARSNTEYSDATLARLLRDERAGWDWPASIHAIVLDLPKAWQLVLIGTALGKSQALIATAAGVSQRHVSTLLSVARGRFMVRLHAVTTTERYCREILGFSTKRLRLF